MVKLRIEMNEDCPCGSGEKYSKCCFRSKGNPISIEKLMENEGMINGLIKREFKNAKFKICLHPNKEECSNKIIDAHTIQKGGVLTRLTENNHVIMINLNASNKEISMDVQSLGKSVATTHKMFCKKHDRETFAPIELKEYKQDEEQNFLYAYRAYASEYYKKMVQIRVFRSMMKNNPSILKLPHYVAHYRGLQLAHKDVEEGLNIFFQGIKNNDYSKIHTYVRELNFEISFAVATAFGPLFDLTGSPLCFLLGEDESRFPLIFLNIFPCEGKSFALFSCFIQDREFYKNLFKQLEELTEKEFIRIMNNFIPEYTESLVMSPRLWNNFSGFMKESLLNRINNAAEIMGVNIAEELNNKKDFMTRAPYNLFRSF